MGHKILLADDSITIQKVIELTFSDEDFELHTVGNGQKAIDEIRSIQPDIVLCDIIMPEKNGYEVCEFIKSNDELKHIPVLLLTGAFEPFDQERAKAAGCEGFLAKPFEPQTLISKVKELLASAQGAPAGAAAPAPPAAMPPGPPAPAPGTVAQNAGPMAGEEDATVMVPPPTMGAPPAIVGPQVPAPPTAPPADPSPGLGEAFAVEAGERELAMEPGDHTVLLGANDVPDVSASPATPPGASDDIWSDAGSPAQPVQPVQPVPPAPEPSLDDGATIFMGEPPPISVPTPSGEASLGGPVDSEMSVGHEDIDATWQMPPAASETPSETPPGIPDAPLPAAGDLGGFEDFAAAPPVVGETSPEAEPPAMDMMDNAPPAPPMMQDEPPAMAPAPELGVEPLAPDPPELGSTNEVSPVGMTPEPFPSVDTQATMDPVKAGGDAFAPLSSTPEPANPEAEPVMPVKDAATESPLPTSEAQVPATSAADDLVERVAQRVVDKLSSKIIQEIAWEVVPDLAEGLIRREIDVLKSKIPKSG